MTTQKLKKLDIPPPKPFTWRNVIPYLVTAVLFCFTYWAGSSVEFSLSRLQDGLPHMKTFLLGMWPPDFSIGERVFKETLLTIHLAWISTVMSAIISVPFGFLAANNLFQSKVFTVIRNLVIFLLNADRAIDALILALFFVSAVGLGPFPGTLALGIHSVGMLAKLFADAIETIDRGPIEALESAGAGKIAMIRWAVWPQVAPHFISYFLFRFELNVRAAIVLGFVGAGGIGFLLTMTMRQFQYQKISTIILVIMSLVLLVDFVSSRLRRAVL